VWPSPSWTPTWSGVGSLRPVTVLGQCPTRGVTTPPKYGLWTCSMRSQPACAGVTLALAGQVGVDADTVARWRSTGVPNSYLSALRALRNAARSGRLDDRRTGANPILPAWAPAGGEGAPRSRTTGSVPAIVTFSSTASAWRLTNLRLLCDVVAWPRAVVSPHCHRVNSRYGPPVRGRQPRRGFGFLRRVRRCHGRRFRRGRPHDLENPGDPTLASGFSLGPAVPLGRKVEHC
jgi:hypothetical protein